MGEIVEALAAVLREEGFLVSVNRIGNRTHLEIERPGDKPELVHLVDYHIPNHRFIVPLDHPDSIGKLIGHLRTDNG